MKRPEVRVLSFEPCDLCGVIMGMVSDRYTAFQCNGNEPRKAADAYATIVVDRFGTAIDRLRNYLARTANDARVLMVAELNHRQRMMELLRTGVSDFVVPLLSPVEFLARLDRLTGFHRDERVEAGMILRQRLGLNNLIGDSESFRAAVEQIPLMAKSDATVLIEGETGTGKEVCARAIHYVSPRADKPFVTLNCAALPLELLENELFGHEQGAYTGATSFQHGLVHEANGGSLFLDEIDSLPTIAQVKLLRLLQEKEYRALGSTKTQSVDARVIAATNCDMAQSVRTGKIREDFYYRLNVLSLTLPPLRERSGDLILLAEHFIRTFAKRLSVPVPSLSSAAVQCLLGHQWPGNVRELEHVIERAVVLADRRLLIQSEHIQLPLVGRTCWNSFQEAKASVIASWERRYIETVLAAHQGNISLAARSAKKNRRAFWELMRKHGIDANRFRKEETRS